MKINNKSVFKNKNKRNAPQKSYMDQLWAQDVVIIFVCLWEVGISFHIPGGAAPEGYLPTHLH